jgi:DNA-binding XRE family transcriptional regulator
MVEMAKQRYTLKELRARKNKTQAEAAADLGVSPQTYNAWEKDISNVGISKVIMVAKYYGVALDDIFLP